VAKIGIFGSFVHWEERTESDVDVLVTFRKGQKTFENYMDCKFYLETQRGYHILNLLPTGDGEMQSSGTLKLLARQQRNFPMSSKPGIPLSHGNKLPGYGT
jgi:hypothetical protein